MMDDIVLHARTAVQIGNFTKDPSHALLLAGPDGIGKGTVARLLARQVLGFDEESFTRHPYNIAISPENNSISIDAIRELQHFLQLKTTGNQSVRRIAIIEHAETMGTEAQNALLKILEEPPADTLLILTANGIRGLLPTILSRVQIITLYPPAESEIRAHFANQSKAASAVTQAYFLSGGLPGLMKAILDEDNEHPLLASVTQAKELLRQKPFERLVQVEALSKQKDKGAHLIDALLRIAEISLDTAAKKESATQIKQWYRILNEVQQAREALAQSANTKLVFTNLMLHM